MYFHLSMINSFQKLHKIYYVDIVQLTWDYGPMGGLPQSPLGSDNLALGSDNLEIAI